MKKLIIPFGIFQAKWQEVPQREVLHRGNPLVPSSGGLVPDVSMTDGNSHGSDSEVMVRDVE